MPIIVRNPIICKDGTKVSVQAGFHAYCSPRDDIGPYTHVEVGFPSVKPDWWETHHGDDQVCGWVPAVDVLNFIDSHGGATNPQDLPPMVMDVTPALEQ